jgi:hypothetical protein
MLDFNCQGAVPVETGIHCKVLGHEHSIDHCVLCAGMKSSRRPREGVSAEITVMGQVIPPGHPASIQVATPQQWGPLKWAELHNAALENEIDQAWLDKWVNSIPGGCQCKNDARALLKAFPFDFNNLFMDSVIFHNRVNKSLGKPEIAFEAAKEIWMK